MINTFTKCIEDMENGVTNFTVNGKCSGCGECCSAMLPMSDKEISIIKNYVKKKNIKPCKHGVGSPINIQFDMICPFLDENKKDKKCLIYPVRPKICKEFQCNIPPSKTQLDKGLFWSTRRPVYMWDVFKEGGD